MSSAMEYRRKYLSATILRASAMVLTIADALFCCSEMMILSLLFSMDSAQSLTPLSPLSPPQVAYDHSHLLTSMICY
jgi:hypothetical protein